MTAIELLRWLGETSLAISLLILLVLIIRKPFAQAFGARAAYALWLAPAARLFVPELKILPAPVQAFPDIMLSPTQTWEYGFVTAPQAVVSALSPASFDWVALAAAVALVLWATIAFAWFSLKLEKQASYLRSRLAESAPASPALTDMAQAIAKDFSLRRAPQLRISETDEEGPCLIGLLRPVIFLPAGFETNYDAAEQRLVLAHEIAHVARGDMIATLAALALQAAQWPNPLAHLSFTAFRADQEAACDSFVLARCAGTSTTGHYASAILKSVRTRTNAPAFGLSLAHPVKERIMLLKSQKKSPLRLAAGAISVAAFTAVSLAATASYGFAEKDEPTIHEATRLSKMVISVDKGETLEVPGHPGAKKIEIVAKDSKRTVKVFDGDEKLLSENVYRDDEAMLFEEVVTVSKDGERRTINIGADAHDVVMARPPLPPVPAIAPVGGAHKVMIVKGDGEHDFHMAHCGEGEGHDAPTIMEWSTKVDGDEADGKVASFEVVCLTSDESADPKDRAEALRKTIARMEENAKRDAERRKEMIARLREELKEVEKKK